MRLKLGRGGGPNDPRLGDAESRFHEKDSTIDYELFKLFVQSIDSKRLHIGVYHTSPSTPEYEGVWDTVRVLSSQAPEYGVVHLLGMSFGPEIQAARHCNKPPKDPHGLDSPLRVLGLSLMTNIVPPPRIPSLKQILAGEQVEVNPTTHGEVVEAGKEAEAYFQPSIIKFLQLLNY